MFDSRIAAGRRLAARLQPFHDPVVLGLPCGGVPVAVEAARAPGLPVDLIIVRKLRVPGEPDLAVGAIGEGGVGLLWPEVGDRPSADALWSSSRTESPPVRPQEQLSPRAEPGQT